MSPLLTFSLITTRSLRFCPNTKLAEDAAAGCAGAGTGLEFRDVTFETASGMNLGASVSSLSLPSVLSGSFCLSVSSSGSSVTSLVTFKKGFMVGFSWAGRSSEPGNGQIDCVLNIVYKVLKMLNTFVLSFIRFAVIQVDLS